MTEITYKEAMKLLEYWKKTLRLQDWTINLYINRKPEEMPLADVDGCVDWVEVKKSAVIDILDPKYYGERLLPYNFESILIHELLHLKMSFWCQETDNISDRLMHQTIDDLAMAFALSHKESEL